jgi:hypothetical protein
MRIMSRHDAANSAARLGINTSASTTVNYKAIGQVPSSGGTPQPPDVIVIVEAGL